MVTRFFNETDGLIKFGVYQKNLFCQFRRGFYVCNLKYNYIMFANFQSMFQLLPTLRSGLRWLPPLELYPPKNEQGFIQVGKKLKRLKAKKACTGRMTLYITLFVALNYVLPSSLVERTVAVFVWFYPKNCVPSLTFTLESGINIRLCFLIFDFFPRGYILTKGCYIY